MVFAMPLADTKSIGQATVVLLRWTPPLPPPLRPCRRHGMPDIVLWLCPRGPYLIYAGLVLICTSVILVPPIFDLVLPGFLFRLGSASTRTLGSCWSCKGKSFHFFPFLSRRLNTKCWRGLRPNIWASPMSSGHIYQTHRAYCSRNTPLCL